MTSLERVGSLAPKRILWLVNIIFDLQMHGNAQIEITRQMGLRGNTIFMLGMRSKKKLQTSIPNAQIHLVPLRFIPFFSSIAFYFVAFISLPFFIILEKPNFIIIEPGPHIINLMWKYLFYPLRIEVILDVRSTPVEVAGIRSRISAFFFRSSVCAARKGFDGITTITRMMKKDICTRFTISQEFVGVWTSGVSTDLFNPEKHDGFIIKKKLGLADKFVIFYHGSLGLSRGVIETVKSIKLINCRCGDLVFFILGEGPAFSIINDFINENELKKNVILHNNVDHLLVPEFVSMCDVAVVPLPNLPDWRYQSPLKLLEYLAMEKVVVVSDIPANRDIIGNNKCGVYVNATQDRQLDPMDIAKGILYAYENKKYLRERGAEGRKIVESKYSWTKVAENFDDYLLKIMIAHQHVS